MKNPISTMIKKITAGLFSLLLAVNLLPGTFVQDAAIVRAAEVTELHEPVVVADSTMEAGQKATWDCVWFGSYPQTEIVDQAATCGTYNKEFEAAGDYIVDSKLYNTLKNATGWSSEEGKGDITIDGVKYRRISKEDALDYRVQDDYYFWDKDIEYHYFRYEPIKWRVLEISSENNTALLFADKALDAQQFNLDKIEVSWNNSTIRSWLNGYGPRGNYGGYNYANNNFIDIAFDADQKAAIVDTLIEKAIAEGFEDIVDKLFLLSDDDVCDDETAIRHGFSDNYYEADEARMMKSSTYTKAMGVKSGIRDKYFKNCFWWLRTPNSTGLAHPEYVTDDGFVAIHVGDCETDEINSVCPALTLNLTSQQWKYAGTVCSDGTKKEECFAHIWDKGTVVTEPTCVKKGLMRYICTNEGCKETKTEEIPATGKHKYETSISGRKKTYKCSVCGDTYTENLPEDDEEYKENEIINKKTDSDVKGSDYAKTSTQISKTTKTSITIKWKGVKGATGYRIYASQCNHAGKIHHLKYKKTAGKTTRTYTYRKLKKGTMYKFLVMAVKGKKVLSTSKTIHIATTGGKLTNAKALTLNVKSVTLKKGKTKAVKVKKIIKYNSKLRIATHKAIKYETSNKKIATVSAKGVVKGIQKGSCYLYAYAQNGVYKKIKVTVK